MKHIACSDSASVFRPAARRIIVCGRTIRAVAIVRMRVWYGTRCMIYQPMQDSDTINLTSLFSKGVPGIGTRALTGKDSGCSGMLKKVEFRTPTSRKEESTYLETSQIKPTRSLSLSPNPRIPPEHTLIPASRTALMVSSLSSYDRVVITYALKVI